MSNEPWAVSLTAETPEEAVEGIKREIKRRLDNIKAQPRPTTRWADARQKGEAQAIESIFNLLSGLKIVRKTVAS